MCVLKKFETEIFSQRFQKPHRHFEGGFGIFEIRLTNAKSLIVGY